MLLPVLFLLPLLAGVAIWAAGDRAVVTRATVALGSLGAVLVVSVLAAGTQPGATVRWGAGLSLRLEVADVARAPVVLVAVVGLAVVTYALGYGERAGRSRMVGLLVAFVGAMELLVVAGDFLSLLTAWELVGLISWGLIGHHWRQGAATEANQAFLATRVGDVGLFLAAGAAYAASGTLRFSSLPTGPADRGLAAVVVAGVLLAAIAKSAQLPFSPWLFSAMAGPTPASALLHSATMVAAGAYLLARLQPFLDSAGWFGPLTIAIGLTTALAGGVVAVVQPEAKKLLAASTSAHYGLMLVAVGAGYPIVAIAHLVAHGLFKALLFVSAGVAIDASGTPTLVGMRLGRRLPVVAGLSAIGALALAAVPPLGAAWTKEEIVGSAAEAAPWVAVLVIAAGALSALYATRFHLLAWGRHDLTVGDEPQRAVGGLTAATIALGLLVACSVALGLLWTPWGEDRLRQVTGGTLPAGATWEIAGSLAAVAVSVYAALVLDRRHRLVTPAPTPAFRRVARWFDLAALSRATVVGPTLALARRAARFDDRVVDAGVDGVGRLAAAVAGGLARGDDRVVDAGIRGVARFGTWLSRMLDRVGELGIDGAVEGLARLTGSAGRDARRLQSGQTHRYYATIAVGLAVLVLVTWLL